MQPKPAQAPGARQAGQRQPTAEERRRAQRKEDSDSGQERLALLRGQQIRDNGTEQQKNDQPDG